MARRRSAFFRFAVALPLLIGVVAGLLLVPIYREAVEHIQGQVRAAIERDSWDLEVEFHEHGIEGLIARIAERTEPLSTRTIPSGEPVLSVLEINGGVSKQLGIKPGDKVEHALFKR